MTLRSDFIRRDRDAVVRLIFQSSDALTHMR